jgi:hypothetical protein
MLFALQIFLLGFKNQILRRNQRFVSRDWFFISLTKKIDILKISETKDQIFSLLSFLTVKTKTFFESLLLHNSLKNLIISYRQTTLCFRIVPTFSAAATFLHFLS